MDEVPALKFLALSSNCGVRCEKGWMLGESVQNDDLTVPPLHTDYFIGDLSNTT